MKIDVTSNAKKNIVVGVTSKVILLILPFISRMVINRTIGVEYLGLNSLFTSILSVLTLSEMGLSSALVYHMYKPIAEDNKSEISSLLNFYRKAYIFIGTFILTIGLILTPFLPVLINGTNFEGVSIYAIYFIQLLNTVLSYYLFAYKQSLLIAYQKDYVNSMINVLIQAGLQIVQIIILLNTKNYYLYILCLPIFTVLNNLWVAFFTKKLFPDIKCSGKVNTHIIKSIKKLVVGSFIQRVCTTTRNSLDSIFISAYVGLTVTAIYNNYFTVFNGITVILSIIATSVSGGIGNHIVIKSVEENFEELKKLDMLYMLVSTWCMICLLCLSQTFMRLWMGENMIFPIKTVIMLCIYFYVLKMGDIRGLYYTATGMWWEMRYRSIGETISNVLLNILLGKFFGIDGIICATIISIVFFNFIWGTKIVFKNYFGENKILEYYKSHLSYILIAMLVSCIVYIVTSKIILSSLLLQLVAKAIVCGILTGILLLIFYSRNTLFRPAIKIIRRKGKV